MKKKKKGFQDKKKEQSSPFSPCFQFQEQLKYLLSLSLCPCFCHHPFLFFFFIFFFPGEGTHSSSLIILVQYLFLLFLSSPLFHPLHFFPLLSILSPLSLSLSWNRPALSLSPSLQRQYSLLHLSLPLSLCFLTNPQPLLAFLLFYSLYLCLSLFVSLSLSLFASFCLSLSSLYRHAEESTGRHPSSLLQRSYNDRKVMSSNPSRPT